MIRIDDNIWPIVQQHGWKWQRRGEPITGIIWHCTRSGQANFSPETEYGATLNWFRSPSNVVRDQNGNPFYAGMANYVVGGGRLCLSVPEELAPRYSAGIHDFSSISVEVAQPLNGMPFDPRDIAICRALADDLASRFPIPRGRLLFARGSVVGEVGHEDTAQGRGQGKSDPGELFWQSYMEEDMADPRVDQIIAALGGQLVIEVWNGPAAAPTGNSLLVGYTLEQVKLAEHIASFHGGGGGKVLPHGHKAVVTTVTSGEVVQ